MLNQLRICSDLANLDETVQVVDTVDRDLLSEVLNLGSAQLHSVEALLMESPTALYDLGGKYFDFQTLAEEGLYAQRSTIYYKFLQARVVLNTKSC